MNRTRSAYKYNFLLKLETQKAHFGILNSVYPFSSQRLDTYKPQERDKHSKCLGGWVEIQSKEECVCHQKLTPSPVNGACAGADADWLFLATHTTAGLKANFCHCGQQERLIKPRKELTKTKLSFYRHFSERNAFHGWVLKHSSSMGEMEGICTKSLVSPSPTTLSSKWPKKQPRAAACEEHLLHKGLCQPCTQVTLSTHRSHSPSLWDAESSCISLTLPLKEARTAPSLPGEVIQPSHTAQLGLRKPSRQQVIFVLFKSIFAISVAFPATK